MINVRRNNHASASHFIADKLRRELLTLSNVLHLLGDNATAGIVHLGKVAVAIFGFPAGDPIRARARRARCIVAVSVLSVRGRHDCPLYRLSVEIQLYPLGTGALGGHCITPPENE